MTQVPEIELRDILLSNSSFGPSEISVILRKVCNDYSQYPNLKEVTGELESQLERTPATSVRLGVCQYMIGNYESAIATLLNADGGALAYFYQGKAYFALDNFDKSTECFESAQRSGYNADLCQLAIAETKRLAKDLTGAMAILDNMFGPIEQTAEYLYQRGSTIAAMSDNPDEVCKLYERAVELEDTHHGALFGLALENDRRGNDERAIELYQRAAASFPTSVGALLNLGLIYEDHDQYERAASCYDRILESHPTHDRALLYRVDAVASMDENYDHDREKVRQQVEGVMSIPISQFELSVRSRNCLQKMGILTLGDLCNISEMELLNSKNFGETSLVEIREMIANKGLMIGQNAHQKDDAEEPVDLSHLSPEEQVLLDRPISDLNLSVRARKCMTRLGLATIGELVRKSQDDLLGSKNFGVTSLTEVREKLAQVNLSLRGE
ncbi:MAG: DNA-directed RNA polymerase subunit alpha [Mariniblastus sp.]|jgi:DNA-directed RNA polymerase subunit alpha